MRKEGYNWSYSWNYTGDWYLLRAKFMNCLSGQFCWEEVMTALQNKHYSGHLKVTEEDL